MERTSDPIALVMGAGGPVGHAFHAGVLRALADSCGFDARQASLVLGTSAGAVAGALLRGGWSPHDLFAAAAGESSLARLLQQPRRSRLRCRWPASPDYLRRVLRRPWLLRPGRLVSALLPEGVVDHELLGDTLRRLHPDGWPARALWVTAVSLDCGTRVVFGHADAPRIDVATAVRCSAAVPWLRRPVRFGDRRFVDGGIASPTHLDVLVDRPPRLLLVSSPLSYFLPLKILLRAELRRLVALGTRVVVFEPDAEVKRAMTWNPMDVRQTRAVANASYLSARRRLEARESAGLRALLDEAELTARTVSSTPRNGPDT
jgi:NTE family protein